MTNACEKWNDSLREAALTGASTRELSEHLQTCADCTAELKYLEARKAQLDSLLPMLAQGSQPSPDFRANVLAAARAIGEKKHAQPWKFGVLAGALATVAILVVVVSLRRQTAPPVSTSELAVAQKLAEWRAPSDTFLATPGQEILRTTPKLGQSYLSVPVKKVQEE
jgi:anti-sigma factor RsiW